MRCLLCNGGKKIIGMGCMEQDCPKCDGTGVQNEERESQTNGKQDKIQRTQRRKTKETVDQSETKSCEGIRGDERIECEMGSGSKDIQEREEIGQSDEEVGHKEIGNVAFGYDAKMLTTGMNQTAIGVTVNIKSTDIPGLVELKTKEALGIGHTFPGSLSSPIKNGAPLQVILQNAKTT